VITHNFKVFGVIVMLVSYQAAHHFSEVKAQGFFDIDKAYTSLNYQCLFAIIQDITVTAG